MDTVSGVSPLSGPGRPEKSPGGAGAFKAQKEPGAFASGSQSFTKAILRIRPGGRHVLTPGPLERKPAQAVSYGAQAKPVCDEKGDKRVGCAERWKCAAYGTAFHDGFSCYQGRATAAAIVFVPRKGVSPNYSLEYPKLFTSASSLMCSLQKGQSEGLYA